jgi:hypothetical protein
MWLTSLLPRCGLFLFPDIFTSCSLLSSALLGKNGEWPYSDLCIRHKSRWYYEFKMLLEWHMLPARRTLAVQRCQISPRPCSTEPDGAVRPTNTIAVPCGAHAALLAPPYRVTRCSQAVSAMIGYVGQHDIQTKRQCTKL